MTISLYSVLKGKTVDSSFIRNNGYDHYVMHIKVFEETFKAFVNILSYEESVLEYSQNFNWTVEFENKLKRMELGSARLLNQPRALSLDYIRSGYVDMSSFIQIPQNISRSESDLAKLIDSCVQRSKSDDDYIVCVFGSAYKDEHGFDVAIHDIHMNQGNFVSGPFRKDNVVYQDGGIFFHFSNNDSWVSLIFKFTSQSNNTNDHTGNPNK